MFGTISLHDYRCFRREAPATLEIRKGFVAFIGPNNAGKSTLIRSLWELRQSFNQLAILSGNAAHLCVNQFGFSAPAPVADPTEVISDRPDPLCRIELSVDLPSEPVGNCIQKVVLAFIPGQANYRLEFFDATGQQVGQAEGPTTFQANSGPNTVIDRQGKQYDISALMALVQTVLNCQFVGPFRNAINEGAGAHYDTQVGTGFVGQWHQWKTGASKAQNTAIQRVTSDVCRLLGADRLEISASNELKTLQVVLDGRPYKLSELGSGISQLIVVLGNALIRQPSFIVIDEPETHLHPALQIDFLTTLASYAEHGVIFATHSIGLARAVSDRCFTVRRERGGTSVRLLERTPHYAEFLGSLGIAALQEIGWDRILLVEGTTDVRVFQQFLRLYDKDRATVVLPLGGGSMIHGQVGLELSEILRLGSQVFAVVDSERAADGANPKKQHADFAQCCEQLGIQCCLTARRATENYFSDRAVKAAFGPNVTALDHYTRLGDAPATWGKSNNWRAAKAMTRNELDDTDLGRFLASI